MLYRVFEAVLSENPDLTAWAIDSLSCVSDTDYTNRENKGTDIPSAFRSCRLININGRMLCVGSSFNLKTKQTLIDKLLENAYLSKDIFKIERILYDNKLKPWQRTAARTVFAQLKKASYSDRGIGIVSQPTGTERDSVLAEVIRLLFEKSKAEQSVLILTEKAVIAEQLTGRLNELSEGFFDVELADSVNKLVGSVGKSNTVILSTVQKLLPKKSVNTGYNENDEIEAFSKSDKLLVIAEDSFGNRFGNKYRYIDARFPNARLMGITDEPKPFSGFTRYFGPLIYRYTYEQAIEDGYFSIAEYENAALLSDYNVTENVYYEGYSSLEREKRLAEFIASREKEQDRFVLVLCSETEQLIPLYNALLAFTEEKKLRLYVPKLYLNSSYKSTDIPDSAIWDGKYFSGILITRTLPAVDMDCSTVYLDKKPTSFELGQVLCMLAGRGKKRKKAGALIDFRNSWNIMQTLFPDGLPLALKSSQYRIGDAKLSESLKLLSEALKTHSYAKAKAVLEIIRNSFPDKGNDLSQQLEFIFPGNMDAEQLKSYWHRHISELAWKCDMWCALSVDSTCCWEKSAETEVISDTAYTAEQIEVTPLPPTGSSQERGALLERQTKQLIRELFDLSEEYSLEELRLQTSGTQFGFDITFTYTNAYGVACTCMLECKNYQQDIQPRDIVDKLSELRTDNIEVDHWILISPNSNVTNTLWQQYKKWREQDSWYPVRDVQIWTPDQNVHELFGLFPHIYSKFYRADENGPATWSEEKRQAVLKHWKDKIAPVPHLPSSWKMYLKAPDRLLTQHEADLITVREYNSVYNHRATARLLDENEAVIEGTAEDYFLNWLNEPGRSIALLLGDFGDGKSFFTYTLARRLCRDFSRSPKAGWLPLRLSLRDAGSRAVDDYRRILEERLKEFSSSLDEWNGVNREYRFLIILDGFDEMSQGMNDAAVQYNLSLLERITEQFRGHKILLTSRKNVIYSDSIRERLNALFRNPETVHLAPISRKSRLKFLEQLADTDVKKERLYKIRNTHDLLGLAAKPLFLNMLREQLNDSHIKGMDMAEIYKDYAEKALSRKYSSQWAREHDYTNPLEVCSRLLNLLGSLAVCLQYEGKESISLN